MEYFKKQLQNQEPIKATTLAQNEIINDREENKASKAGALHILDEEPKDVARRMKSQGEKLKEDMKASKKDDENKMMEMRRSLKPVSERKISPQPLRPRIPHPKQNLMEEIRQAVPVAPSSEEMQSSVVSNLQQQQEEYENLMSPNPFEALEEEDTRVEFPSEMELEKRREMNRREANEKRNEFNLERAGAGSGVGAVEPPKRKGRGPNKTKEQKEAEAQAKKEKASQREAKRQQKQEQQKSKKDRRK
jgi:colicin import membrane protein